MDLQTFLGRIFQSLNKTKKTAHRTITTFLGQFDDVIIEQASEAGVIEVPFPAYWADSVETFDPEEHFYWDEAFWADAEDIPPDPEP